MGSEADSFKIFDNSQDVGERGSSLPMSLDDDRDMGDRGSRCMEFGKNIC